jgi:hypothetical protein
MNLSSPLKLFFPLKSLLINIFHSKYLGLGGRVRNLLGWRSLFS